MVTNNLEFPEQALAAQLLKLYGRNSNDYFKLWPDKEYWFNEAGTGFVAYGVSRRVALVLGDPIGPEREIEHIIRGFGRYCNQQGWTPLFYQVGPDFIEVFERLGYRRFKGSEEALVNLERFSIKGKEGKQFRSALNKMERAGITAQLFDSPVPDEIIEQAREVSESWLSTGKRERTFTLGRFIDEYVRQTPMMAVMDADERVIAFANIIPSYEADTATVDMMRHRADVPNGTMDFLFLKLFDHNREAGFQYFSLGAAPIISPEPGEKANLEEKAFYQMTRYLDSFFSMKGLRQFKEKYATEWEPRYLVYRHRWDMPRFAQAINDLCELDENKVPLISRTRARQIRRISLSAVQEIRELRPRRYLPRRRRITRPLEKQEANTES